jgi:isoamylase
MEVELSGPLKEGQAEALQAIARQGANAMEIAKQVESLPPEKRAEIEGLRARQMKNMLAVLALSRGTPMLVSGDEVGRTANGNNNFWCNEELNALDWSLVEKNADQLRFTQQIFGLRDEFKIGRLQPEQFTWHGVKPLQPDRSDTSHFIAFEVPSQGTNGKRLYAAINEYWQPLSIELPAGNWRRRADTNLTDGQDIVGSDAAAKMEPGKPYVVQPRTAVIFESE